MLLMAGKLRFIIGERTAISGMRFSESLRADIFLCAVRFGRAASSLAL